MKLLVTGGCGFIGSNFIRYIAKKHKNYRITNLDKLTYAGNLENTKDVNGPNHKFIHGDICNEKLVDKIAGDIDVIINFAAESHVDRSIVTPQDFIKTNVFGTSVLLEAAKKYKHQKYIQISTDECYGSIEEGSFTEDSPLKPSSPYSASKAAGDMLAYSYFVTYNVPTIITRSSNNFGPYQYPEKVIPLFITNAIQDKELPLYGDGKNVRDWLYVLDNCEAIDLILHKGSPGETYNVSSNHEKQNIELTHKILEELNKPTSLIKPVKDRLGHDRRYSIDSTKLRKLGWEPKYSFDEALKQTIDWYKTNRDWWEEPK